MSARLLALVCALVLAPAAGAAVWVVERLDDPPTFDFARLSLRQAIVLSSLFPAEDVILLRPGGYLLLQAGSSEDIGLTGDIDTRGPITIIGAGAGSTTIDAVGLILGPEDDRVIDVRSGALTLRSLTVRNGRGVDGGGIRVASGASLTLRACVVRGCRSTLWGGAIASEGEVTVRDSTIRDCRSAHAGGALISLGGTATLRDSTISNNRAQRAGGAIHSWSVLQRAAQLTVQGCVFSGNVSTGWLDAPGGPASFTGGAIAVDGDAKHPAGTLLQSTTFILNRAPWGGAVDNGYDALMTVEDCDFLLNIADRSGGALVNHGACEIRRGDFIANVAAERGGGIENWASLTLEGSSLRDNSAATTSGALANSGVAYAVGCTFAGNDADEGGMVYNNGPLTLDDCTISGNAATVGGGAVRNSIGGELSASHCTFTGNAAPAGAIFQGSPFGTAAFAACILADSVGGEGCLRHGGLVSLGANCDEDGSFGFAAAGDLVADPRLGALADHGGPTRTHLPLAGSPAIDAAGTTGGPTDQRGALRPFDGDGDGVAESDIGAVERGAPLRRLRRLRAAN